MDAKRVNERLKNFGLMLFGVLWVAFADVVFFRIPILSLIICPSILVVMVVSSLFMRGGFFCVLRSMFSLRIVFLLLSIFITPLAGSIHDRLITNVAVKWGDELISYRDAHGGFPRDSIREFNGYKLRFFNESKFWSSGAICFDKYDQMRQCYLVETREFLEEKDFS